MKQLRPFSFALLTTILFCTSFSSHVQAQQTVDPRPLHNPSPKDIPTLKQWKLTQGTNNLRKFSSTAGKASRTDLQIISREEKAITPPSVTKTNGLWRVLRSANGTVNWMWLARPAHPRENSVQSIASDPLPLLQSLRTTLKLQDPKSELRVMEDSRDATGKRHVRYAQFCQGIPVWKKDLYVHYAEDNVITTINGTYAPTPVTVATSPSLEGSIAANTAIEDLKREGAWAPVPNDAAALVGSSEPGFSLVIYAAEGRPVLAYDIEVLANLYESYEYIVDATNGKILHRLQRSCSLMPVDRSKGLVRISTYNAVPELLSKNASPAAVGFTDGSGIDLNGITKNFRCYLHTDGSFYSITDLPDFDANKSNLPNSPVGGAMALSLQGHDLTQDAQLLHITSASSIFTDRSGIDAVVNMKASYDYYRSTFTRDAIDGKNSLILSVVHATQGGQGMDNAFWNGKAMIYGDGLTNFKPLAGGLDVGGHEMTHGVIGNSADLVYEFQSGALNESFADVFGVMIEPSNLTVGENVMLPGKGSCLRDLENPANPTGLAHQPTQMSEFLQLTIDQDNGGVHQNSGIPNRAAAIIIKALGRDKAQKIYYQALTKYLTRNSQFIDCRHACESAAKDFFGSGSELQTVSNAFATVGIGEGTSNGGDNNLPPQTGGVQGIAMTAGTGQVGVIDPVAGTVGLFASPAAVARVSGEFRAQLTTPRTGQEIWFVGQDGLLTFIDVVTGNVRNFPNLKIAQTGDLWNAAISPDGNFVALTSASNVDPNIYVFDGTQLFKFPLLVETGDGSGLPTIQYPDVINWSPNKSLPRLGLDAYNEEAIAGQPYGYWSMYEMNFDSKRVYDLIPAQPQGIDVGNITYSNTDPDVVAFNVLSNSVSDVAVANFQLGVINELGIPNFTIGGNPISDAGKPTFRPDDNFLAFSSPSNSSLVFYSQPSGTPSVTFLQFPQPIYNPYWFLLDGSAGVKPVLDPAFEVTGASPSFFTNEVSVSFKTPLPTVVRCELLNLFGEQIAAISESRFDAGTHSVELDASRVAAGVYFIRVSSGQEQRLIKVIKQ